MGGSSHWLGQLVRAGIAAALLVPWHGPVHAAPCDADIVEAMLFAMEPPAPERTAPAASPPLAIAAEKLRGATPPSPGAAISGLAACDDFAAVRLPDPRLPDRPWRPYCARSARLLR